MIYNTEAIYSQFTEKRKSDAKIVPFVYKEFVPSAKLLTQIIDFPVNKK